MEWPARTLSLKGELGLTHCLGLGEGWILAGGHSDSGAAFSDLGWISSTRSDGKRRWVRRTGSESDYVQIKCLAPTSDGGLLVGGSRTWRSGEDARGFLLALNKRGKERWSFEFGQLESNGVGGVLSLPGGGGVYARHEYLPTVPNPGRDDWSGHDFLCGIDASGQEGSRRELQWEISSSSVVQLVPWPGGVACLVAAAVWGEGSQDFPLVLFAGGGEVQQVQLRESQIATPVAMVSCASAGAAILGGVGWTSVGPKQDPVLLRLGSARDVLWERRYGDPETDMPTCLAATPQGGFVLGGVRLLEGHGHPPPLAVWLIGTDPEGEPLWSQTFHSGHTDRLTDVSVDAAGRVLAVGSTRAPKSPETSWTLSLDAQGRPDPWFEWRGLRLRLPWASDS